MHGFGVNNIHDTCAAHSQKWFYPKKKEKWPHEIRRHLWKMTTNGNFKHLAIFSLSTIVLVVFRFIPNCYFSLLFSSHFSSTVDDRRTTASTAQPLMVNSNWVIFEISLHMFRRYLKNAMRRKFSLPQTEKKHSLLRFKLGPKYGLDGT